MSYPRRKTPTGQSSLQGQIITPSTSDTEAQAETDEGSRTPTPIENFDLSQYEAHREKVKANKQRSQEYRELFDDNMQNKPVRYEQVCVLLLHWEKNVDDLSVETEVKQLQEVFKQLYRFDTTSKTMNHETNAELQIVNHLATFMMCNNKPNTLLIIYYAGHGSYDLSNGLVLRGSTSQQTEIEKQRNDVVWSQAENLLKYTAADVLVVFDCCQAGGVGGYDASDRMPVQPKPNFEYLAACGRTERTRKPGVESFTSALIWALTELHKGDKPFTTLTLLAKIKDYARLPKGQTPLRLTKKQFADGLLWISPSRSKLPEPSLSDYRRPNYDFIDLRLHYYTEVDTSDITYLAKFLSRRIANNPEFKAKHAVLLKTSSKDSRTSESILTATDLFRQRLGKHRKRSLSTTDSPDLVEVARDLTYGPTGNAPAIVIQDTTAPRQAPQSLQATAKRRRLSSPETQLQEARFEVLAENELAQNYGALFHLHMFVYSFFQGMTARLTDGVKRMRPRAATRRTRTGFPLWCYFPTHLN